MDFSSGYVKIANWKDPPFSMGKSTISTGPFSIANCNKLPEGKPPFSQGFPMVFPAAR